MCTTDGSTASAMFRTALSICFRIVSWSKACCAVRMLVSVPAYPIIRTAAGAATSVTSAVTRTTSAGPYAMNFRMPIISKVEQTFQLPLVAQASRLCLFCIWWHRRLARVTTALSRSSSPPPVPLAP